MEAFVRFTGLVCPLDRNNVDTDAIIPKQYLKSIKRTGFGPYLFDDWRYIDPGTLETDITSRRINETFILNDSRFAGAQILLARENFGCGSSREHAVWALDQYGFKVVIAPSFADIFFNNCFKNGVLPIVLTNEQMDELFEGAESNEGYALDIDLAEQKVIAPNGSEYNFDIEAFRKHCLLEGLDDIGLTLQKAEKIRAYEAQRAKTAPWLFKS